MKDDMLFGCSVDVGYEVQVFDADGKIIWECPYYLSWRRVIDTCTEIIHDCSKISSTQIRKSNRRLLSAYLARFSNFLSWSLEDKNRGKVFIIDPTDKYNGLLVDKSTCFFVDQDVYSFIADEHKKIKKTADGYEICFISCDGVQDSTGFFITLSDAEKMYSHIKIGVCSELAYNSTSVEEYMFYRRHQ